MATGRLREPPQVLEGHRRPAERRRLPGGGAQPVEQQVQVPVAEARVDVRGESAWQRAGQTDDEHADVAGGDIGAQRPGSVRRVDQRLDGGWPGITSSRDFRIVEVHGAEESGDDRRGPHVDRPVHVPRQGAERVGLVGSRLPGLLDRALDGVDDHLAHQRLAGGESSVEGGDPGPGPAGDLLQGGAGAVLDEHVARRFQQPPPVAAGVGAQRPRARGVRCRHLVPPPACRGSCFRAENN
jgi:hypothetical protein